MKKNKIQDERIILERREIQSKGYAWIITILLISVIVQQFFMHAPFSQFAVEFFILVGSGFYNIISNLRKGIDIWGPAGDGRKKILSNVGVSGIVSGVISVVLLIFLSGEYNIKNLILYFVTFVVIYSVFRIVMININHKKQQAIEKKLDEEEQEREIN